MVEDPVGAVIFDLDGILTDTAEYHFLAWKQLAGEEGLPFDRKRNESLCGVPRRESLQIILDGKAVSEEKFQQLMDRKNQAYREMLAKITTADLSPGVGEFLDELNEVSMPWAVASASRNALEVAPDIAVYSGYPLVDISREEIPFAGIPGTSTPTVVWGAESVANGTGTKVVVEPCGDALCFDAEGGASYRIMSGD